MNLRETALFGLVAAVFSIVFCGSLIRVAGQQAHLSSAQASSGLAICLAGIVVGLLLVLCVSAFQEAKSVWDRSLGALGLLLGCTLLLALLFGRRPLHAPPPPQPTQEHVAFVRGTLFPSGGSSR